MQSSELRWIIAGIFVAFLLVTIFSDVMKRRPKGPKIRDEGFRRAPPPSTDAHRPQPSWKAPRR